MEHGRRPELDGLRGVAVLLVVFAHATRGVFPTYRGWAPWLESHGGLAGVQLFFVLSGFLITGVLLDGAGLLRFYRRRFQRLAPTLIVVVLAYLVWTGDAWGAVRALTYTENILGGRHGDWFLSHTWSLSVEEQFYLVWPVLLLAAKRHAATVAAVGVVGTWVLQQVVGWSDAAVYVGLRWDAVLAGCFLALVGWRAGRAQFAAGAAVLATFTLGLVPDGRWMYPVATIAAALMVASASSIGALKSGWLRHVGRISYAWYLWHLLAMRLDIPMVGAVALGLVLAEVTYWVVDRQAQRRHR